MLSRSDRKDRRFPALLLLALAPLLLAAKGCDVATVGEDSAEQACGGLAGLACDAAEYCDYPADALCGAADASGVCKPMPEVCTDEYAPVCGCNEVTYGNACSAQAAGVSVARAGECDEPGPGSCGGLLGQACADDEFCNYPATAQCGAADATGVCTALPMACDDIYDPVCGCDDVTYSSGCEANRAGVSVASSGECGSTVPACGGLQGLTCASGEFCAFAPGSFCGAADATGVCTAQPEACDAVLDPVCGCDDVTYGNECEANAAGVSAAHVGSCDEPGASCGGFTGQICPEGQYCNYPEAAQCGAADATGLCADIRGGCTKESAPVCGCDGETYGNPCMAGAAGVSIASQGPCP